MRSFCITSVLLIVTLVLTGCQPDVGTLPNEDVAEINKVVRGYQQSVIDGNWDAFTALFTEDAVYMIPNEPIIEGRIAIREMMGVYPPFPDMILTANVIDGRADLAFVRGTFSLTMPAEGEGKPIKEVGKYLWIIMKKPNGKWQITAESFSSDRPASEQ